MKKIGLAVIRFLVGLVALTLMLAIGCGTVGGILYGFGKLIGFIFSVTDLGLCIMIGCMLILLLMLFVFFLYGAWKLGEMIVRKVWGG